MFKNNKKQSNRSVLDFISSVILGTMVSISGIIVKYWDDIIRSKKFLKPDKKFDPLDVYPPVEMIRDKFYKDRRKALRTIIGIALIILGIIIIAYADIIYHS